MQAKLEQVSIMYKMHIFYLMSENNNNNIYVPWNRVARGPILDTS